MRNINDLNWVGTGTNRRVETKDGADNQQVVVTYPRPANGLSTDEKARFASFAAKGLAHLGFGGASEVHAFARQLKDQADSEAAPKATASDDCGDTIVVNGITYKRA